MATLLAVLKIIGIVLLCILAFVMAVLLIVLFVPVRYKADLSYDEELYVKGRITYLLILIFVRIIYSEELSVVLRILGIPIRLLPKKEGKAGKDKKAKKKDKDKDKKDDTSEASSSEEGEANGTDTEGQTTDGHKVGKNADEDKTKDKNEKSEADEQPGKFDKIKQYIDLLSDESTIRAWDECKYRLGKLLKAIVPQKININVLYGLDDPYKTAQIMSVYNVFYTYIGEGLTLMPVYYEKTMEIDGHVKGRIMAAPILWQALMVLLNKDCRRFIKRFRKINDK